MTALTTQYEACDLEADGIQDIVDRARKGTIKRSPTCIERYETRIKNLRSAAKTLFWMKKHETEIRAYAASIKETAG